MACSCKKNVNPKYLEDGELERLNGNAPNGIEKVGNALFQVLFGLLVGLIIVIASIPAFIYIIVCLCLGRQMKARIPNYTKWFKKE